jgi:hypothetical protein
MTALFQAHSGLRFLVLLLGAVHVLLCGISLAGKRPFDKLGRVLGSIFAGLLHLQVLLGFGLVMMRAWYPQLAGHLVCMLGAAVLAQAMMSMNRRSSTPGWKKPLIGSAGALLLIIAGIYAIGRGPFTMTVGQ